MLINTLPDYWSKAFSAASIVFSTSIAIVIGPTPPGTGVILETLSITDRSYLLFDGQILKSGSSEFLANDEEARRLYLGEKFKLD